MLSSGLLPKRFNTFTVSPHSAASVATLTMASADGVNVAAVIISKGARVTVTTRPVPNPGEGHMLVRNRAIACNPVDWKIQEWSLFMSKYPTVLGSDVAGEVVSVGPGVTHFVPGDRVTGYSGVYYNQDIDHGAWQTYTILPELSSCKLPSSLSFEQGAVFPMGMAAAAVALFHVLAVPREQYPVDSNEALIIWGAASSVGASAVQIARAFGWKILATASPQHHEWLRKLGVTELFDYHDPEVVAKIGQAVKDRGLVVRRALDPISIDSTLDLVPKALNAAGGLGGKIAILVPRPADKPEPESVEIGLSAASRHATDLKELGRWFFNNWLEKNLADGSVIPVPEIQIVDGGVSAAQKAFDQLKAGVSGKKLVVRVS